MRNDRTEIDDRLFIGGLMAYATPLVGIDLAINVASELADEDDRSVSHARLRDDDDVESQRVEISRAVDLVVAVRLRGGVVLVTCAEGRNRSCLVAVEVLVQEGMAVDDAISKVVSARSRDAPRVLSNQSFLRWLRRER